MQSGSTGPVRPVAEGEPSRRSGWQAAGAVALTLVLLIVVLLVLGRDGAVEETTVAISVPTPSMAATTTTAGTTTTAATTIVPGIVAFPDSAYPDAGPYGFGPWVAVSAGEVWAVVRTPECSACLIGHLVDGAWAYWRLTGDGAWVGGLAVAPEGAVWAATGIGVFSFDGAEWTWRLDGPAQAVAVDQDGTVWIGGSLEGRVWLVRGDGESWERVEFPQWFTGTTVPDVDMAVLAGGEVWITTAQGGWCSTGPLMHYDGATMEEVQVGGRPFSVGEPYAWAVEAAPNGDLWVEGFFGGYQLMLARFDGEAWTLYDWPFSPIEGCWDPLLDMAVGPDGVVWLAYPGGLGSFDGTEWTPHIEGDWITSVEVAPDGAVWYGDLASLHTLSTP
jgi:hypothetical protein